MRDSKTYRADRRNGLSSRGKKGHRTLIKAFEKLSGENWKRKFEDKSKYGSLSRRERKQFEKQKAATTLAKAKEVYLSDVAETAVN